MPKKLYTYNQSTLEYIEVSSRTTVKTIVIASISVLIFLGISAFKDTDSSSSSIEAEVITILTERDRFTPEKLEQEIKRLNMKFPDIVYAQAIQETGHFKSKIFLQNNNLFGMKEATVRATTNIGTENGHAVFNSWQESVIDYALYQSKYLSRMNREQYLEFLAQNYAEDPNYVDRLNKLIQIQK